MMIAVVKQAFGYYRSIAWWLWLLPVLLLAFAAKYTLGINVDKSLPYAVFVIEKGNLAINHGDLVGFRWSGGYPLPEGITLIKRVLGMPGDTVVRTCADTAATACSFAVLEAGSSVPRAQLRAKPFDKNGQKTLSGPTGVIPEQRYFVSTEHPDSLDSRYARPGWVPARQLLGKVVWQW